MKSIAHRLLTGTLIGAMGLFALIPTTHARLIFTTEDSGTAEDSTYIDMDDSSTTFINLGFGSDLTNSLQYDIVNDKFILTDALDLSGTELMNFMIDNKATEPVACSGATTGQLYYNTGSNDLKLCNGTAWVSIEAGGIGDDSITGVMLNPDVAGVGLVQDGSGNLDVSLDEVAAAAVSVATDSIAIIDADDSSKTKKESILDFVAGIVGNGLTSTNGVAAIQADGTTGAGVAPVSVTGNGVGVLVDDSTIDHSSGTIGIKDAGVTATQLATSVAGDGLTGGAGTALAIGAGNGVTVAANDITINADGTTGATVAPVSVTGNGVGVTVDNSTINHTAGTIEVADAGVTETQLNTSVAGGGLTGGAGTALAIGAGNGVTVNANDITIAADNATGATVAPVSVGSNGVGVSVDNSTIDHSTGTLEIKDDGVTFTQLAEREVTYTLTPEFENFTLAADGTTNVGTMYADYDSTNKRNYYQWTTKNTSVTQDYDLVLQWAVPENMQGFSLTSDEIEIDYKTDTTVAADNQLDITLLDTAGTVVALTGGTALASSTADTWVDDSGITFTGGTFTPGEYITMTIKMSSQATSGADLNPAYIGQIKFNVRVK